MGNMKAEIDLLRAMEPKGFYHFYARLIRNHPESSHSKANLILYAACELAAMDCSDQDISLIYLLENKIFDDPNYSGHFLTDFSMSLKDGAAILKDAAQYLKQHDIEIPLNSDHNPNLEAISKLLDGSQRDMLLIQRKLDKQTQNPEFENENKLAKASLNNYIDRPEWQSELFFYLREYCICLESKLDTEPENQKSLNLINHILSTESQNCINYIQNFIALQKPTDTLGQAIIQKIRTLLTYIFNQELYKQYAAFKTYRAAWSQPKEAPSQQQSSEENTENKENQAPLRK